MTFPFNPHQGLILVNAELEGPSGAAVLRLALDTGATTTVVSAGILLAVGYDPAYAPTRVQVTTGSGVEFAPRLEIARLRALGQERSAFPILGLTLPPSASIDGVLGLDFLRGLELTVDFRLGQVMLA